MSKYTLSKAAAILMGFSMMAASTGVVFAQNVRQVAVPAAKRINITNIEKQIAATREKLASKEAALKLKLQTFRDQKKATAAARISTNLNQINQNQTTQMQKHLDTMTSILDRLEARVNQPKAAIASVRETIATASAAVSAQAQKDYTIQVTSESRIGIDARTQRDKLRTDILALRKAVIDAKQAVANAIRVARSGSKEGTSNGQQ